jgi:hypothetical protein
MERISTRSIVAPNLDDASIAAYRIVDHPDRKPYPGMIMQALSDSASILGAPS